MTTTIDMLLFCPRCQFQHVDEPEPENGWTNPPHATHTCKSCGLNWRPSNAPTNGVDELSSPEQKHAERFTASDPRVHVPRRKAKALVAQLGGSPLWEVRVHENLGWHYSAINASRTIIVYEYVPGERYTAFLNTPEQLPGGRWTGEGKTAKEAVNNVLAAAKAERDEIDAILKAAYHGITEAGS